MACLDPDDPDGANSLAAMQKRTADSESVWVCPPGCEMPSHEHFRKQESPKAIPLERCFFCHRELRADRGVKTRAGWTCWDCAAEFDGAGA